MELRMLNWLLILGLPTFLLHVIMASEERYVSATGDSGMRRDGLRVAIESWNQCNEVGEEVLNMGSPRMADCFDIDTSCSPGIKASTADIYATKKEIYLGNKCQVADEPRPWQFWMIMLKSGNMDTLAAICPRDGMKATPFPPDHSGFPCFGKGCMNMPLIYHDYTSLIKKKNNHTTVLRGSFYGTWDLDANVRDGVVGNGKDTSYFKVTWSKKVGKGSWVFHHILKTSSKYPWLMLYLRSDATTGFSGGYHYQTRGMLKIIPKSPNFKVKFTLNIKRGGGPRSQFYLLDIGGCWKNNGKPCNGDVTTDVTRYSEMIINPDVEARCRPQNLRVCPPYHMLPNGTRIHRTDFKNFPYAAYHLYCSPGNAKYLEQPYSLCDPYSNPQPQEILQILPHPVWGEYGYPTRKGEGWKGDSRTWELDTGRLSQALYFYQDSGTEPAERYWPSIDLGTEIYISGGEDARWSVSDFDVIVNKERSK